MSVTNGEKSPTLNAEPVWRRGGCCRCFRRMGSTSKAETRTLSSKRSPFRWEDIPRINKTDLGVGVGGSELKPGIDRYSQQQAQPVQVGVQGLRVAALHRFGVGGRGGLGFGF